VRRSGSKDGSPVFNLPVVHPGADLETGFVHAGHTGMINHYRLGDDFDAFVP
jgi:hypothetical protein